MLPYAVMFGSAFLAATLLPFYSEIVLAAYIVDGKSAFLLWLAASVGNILGSFVNYGLGWYLLKFQSKRWFPVKKHQLEKAQKWFSKWGQWSLLMAWSPVGGDALTYVAGLMKIPLLNFFILVGIGKALRYAAVILLTNQM